MSGAMSGGRIGGAGEVWAGFWVWVAGWGLESRGWSREAGMGGEVVVVGADYGGVHG